MLLLTLCVGCAPRTLPETQEVEEAAVAEASGAKTWQLAIPSEGRFRALVVLVRFRDDTLETKDGCTRSERQWPLDATLPAFAPHLLAPSPTPPFADSSLTDFFYRQSRGRFILYGDVLPRVIVTEEDEAGYARLDGPGRKKLTTELLRRLDAEVDFSRYDANNDGYLDHLFVITRRERRDLDPGWAGISDLGLGRDEPTVDGVRVNGALSGSFNRYGGAGILDPLLDIGVMMAHEFGHDLWPVFRNAHLNPIADNDVPYGEDVREASRRVGYAFMSGRGSLSKDVGGAATASAYERSLLPGWIECPALDITQTVTLGDLYTTGDCRRLDLGAGSALYLSNRQRVGAFDRTRRPPSSNCGACQPIDGGLMATGLMVELVRRGQRDLLPADNILRTPTDCEFPHAYDVYDGDLFTPSGKQQLTPWTRPNINGTTQYPANTRPAWHALDALRYTDDGRLAFDFIEDFRSRPVIRANSWIGPETATAAQPFVFQSEVRVTEGSTLTLTTQGLGFGGGLAVMPGTALVLEAGTRATVPAGAEAVVQRGARLRLAEGALLEVRGTLVVEGEVVGAERIVEVAQGRVVRGR